MPISNKLADGLDEVDVIIAGGGTAACIVAGRLAAANPGLSILVIEGGQNNYENHNVVNPGLFREHLRPGSKSAIFYSAKATPSMGNKERVVPAGGLLGGGSSVNLMLYTRAQRSDFDSWNTPGWSTDELIPFLKKFETYHGAGNEKTHGYNGPIHVSGGGYKCAKSEQDFIDACTEVGYPEYQDMNDLDSNNGTERWMRYVSPQGKRQDTAHCYLHPLLRDGKHPNLHVLCESKVVRVLFDENKKATGVEYTPNPDYVENTDRVVGSKSTIKARKLVVVSCGAIGSPLVLERSGVGDRRILEKAGVPLVEDLPGVGHDYQDHNLIFYPYRTNLEPHETMDAIFRDIKARDEAVLNRSAILRWNTCDVSSKIRPTDAEVAALGPEFQKAWNKDFKDNPNRPLMLVSLVSSFLEDPASVPAEAYVSLAAYTAYPYSRGKLHITGPNWEDPIDFDLGFFTDPHDIDLKKQIWAYKKHREIMRRTKMYRGELAIGHPKFAESSPAGCKALDAPIAGPGLKNLEYSEEDEVAIEKFIRENIQTTWHYLGTAKMAPRDQNGVVDKDLNVYGVEGLKVVDLSIAPENVAANTENTALLIGEKAASIILAELGLEEKPIPGLYARSDTNGTNGVNGH
ncbi:hypothetical protein H2200_013163 [Cladophialophora chaetospira]|uniref:Glucose-methanol-choline oxidoreductase N-terminal domain-containing protein n=1 Tax=Cladophialophora chaetospira TaxID=386627 RepID=A0AA38WW92_9EURO|nr:hypothetical protein H2200_013163 [Cladophialophora chaetospira]